MNPSNINTIGSIAANANTEAQSAAFEHLVVYHRAEDAIGKESEIFDLITSGKTKLVAINRKYFIDGLMWQLDELFPDEYDYDVWGAYIFIGKKNVTLDIPPVVNAAFLQLYPTEVQNCQHPLIGFLADYNIGNSDGFIKVPRYGYCAAHVLHEAITRLGYDVGKLDPLSIQKSIGPYISYEMMFTLKCMFMGISLDDFAYLLLDILSSYD